MIQFFAVIALASLFAKGAMLLWDVSGWLVIPYIAIGFVGGWFLQTHEEKQATIEFWRKRL